MVSSSRMEKIASLAWTNFMASFCKPTFQAPYLSSDLTTVFLPAADWSQLEAGFNPGVRAIVRATNPRQLGTLSVIHMDLPVNSGSLLILHVPGSSVADIIDRDFMNHGLVGISEPWLQGSRVLVAVAPCYVSYEAETSRGRSQQLADKLLAFGQLRQAWFLYQDSCQKNKAISFSKRAKCYYLMAEWDKAFEEAEKSETFLKLESETSLNNFEALQIKAKAALHLQLYDVSIKSFQRLLRFVSKLDILRPRRRRGRLHGQIVLELEVATRLKQQALHGISDDHLGGVSEEQLADYVSEQLEIRALEYGDARSKWNCSSVHAKDFIHAGKVIVVSNGIEEGPDAFSMVLDACARSRRCWRQVEQLWYNKLYESPLAMSLPQVIPLFRPPTAPEMEEHFVDQATVWYVVKRATMKGNGSSLWIFPSFFDEAEKCEEPNVEVVQVNARTMVLRTNRDIQPGEKLMVPAKHDAVETRFHYDNNGILVMEKVWRGVTKFRSWLLSEKPPADVNWSSYVNELLSTMTAPYRVDELDGRPSNEILLQELVLPCRRVQESIIRLVKYRTGDAKYRTGDATVEDNANGSWFEYCDLHQAFLRADHETGD